MYPTGLTLPTQQTDSREGDGLVVGCGGVIVVVGGCGGGGSGGGHVL